MNAEANDPREIILRELRSGDDKDVRLAIHDVVDGENKEVHLALMREQPELYIRALDRGDQALDVNPTESSNVFEAVIDAVDDTNRTRHVVSTQMQEARRTELLLARGDRSSTAVLALPMDDIIRAVCRELEAMRMEFEVERAARKEAARDQALVAALQEGEQHEPEEDNDDDEDEDEEDVEEEENYADEEDALSLVFAGEVLRGWVFRLRDRQDFDVFLEQELFGHATVRQLLLTVVWTEAGSPVRISAIAVIDPARFSDVGLDPDEDKGLLIDMVKEDRMPRISMEDFSMVQGEVARQQHKPLTKQGAERDAILAESEDLKL